MNSRKCPKCRLVSFATDSNCRRCGAELGGVVAATDRPEEVETLPWILRRAGLVLAVISGLLLLAYLSFIATSDSLSREQRQIVDRAILVLDERGFRSEVFLLRRLVGYRSTDTWWNRWIGHANAFASTNFPFEVITVYPDFFNRTIDDVERAAILLHEAYHLRGYGEAKAHRAVWLLKDKLGWTQDVYGKTRCWRSVTESTMQFAPELFIGQEQPDNLQ